jgi:hypothetical protein
MLTAFSLNGLLRRLAPDGTAPELAIARCQALRRMAVRLNVGTSCRGSTPADQYELDADRGLLRIAGIGPEDFLDLRELVLHDDGLEVVTGVLAHFESQFIVPDPR